MKTLVLCEIAVFFCIRIPGSHYMIVNYPLEHLNTVRNYQTQLGQSRTQPISSRGRKSPGECILSINVLCLVVLNLYFVVVY